MVVTNPDSRTAVAPVPFTVISGGAPSLWIDLVGREQIRPGYTSTYVVRFGNNGDIDALAVPLQILGIPGSAAVDVRFDVLPPPDVGDKAGSLDWSGLPTCMPYGDEQGMSLLVWSIPPGATGELEFGITLPAGSAAGTDFNLQASLSPSLLSPCGCAQAEQVSTHEHETGMAYIASGDGDSQQGNWFACLVDVVNLLAETPPTYACMEDILILSLKAEESLGMLHWPSGSGPIGDYPTLIVAAVIDCTSAVVPESWIPAALAKVFGGYMTGSDCTNLFGSGGGSGTSQIAVTVVNGSDRRSKVGPLGYDPSGTSSDQRDHWVSIQQPFFYRIDFWNAENATAAARDVVVDDPLDSGLDRSTFQFTGFNFLGLHTPLDPCQYFSIEIPNVTVDLSKYFPGAPAVTLVVQVQGTFNPTSGLATWEFHALDAATRQPPDDPRVGFLPPITASGLETAWVDFQVAPKAGLPTGTQILNQAFIKMDVADFQPAPTAGPFVNTLDVAPPISSVSSLPAVESQSTFPVSWSGADDAGGSGVRDYTIYVSDDGAPYAVWLAGTADTSASFAGSYGHTYRFYSCARDNVGNQQPTPAEPDAVTTVVQAPSSDFSATPTFGIAPLLVSFTYLGSATPTWAAATAWQWDFGDGGSSTQQSPSHTYTVAGSYTVSLIASDAGGSATATKSNYITVNPPAPPCEFSATPTSGVAPLLVQFADESTNSPTSWSWSFGDGSTSTQENPMHSYAKPGSYTVRLIASNSGGSTTATKPHYVLVSFPDVPVQPAFWALDQILACVDAGIVAGYPDGTYGPANAVTRDQMAVYISRALAGGDGKVPTGPATATFSDVPIDYWACKYVEYAAAQNVVQGYSDGTYKPTDQVDRGQMAVFIARSIYTPTAARLDLTGYAPPATATFPDVATDFWAYKYVEYIAQPGIAVTKGYPDGDYHPEYICTRDQMAVYVARAFKLPL